MARKRQIDPDLWKSQQFIRLGSPWAMLMFIGMISNADDEGRMKASPLYIKSTIFPGSSHSLSRISGWRQKIEEQRLILIYTDGDENEYLVLPNFLKYQYMTKRYPSKLPVPPPVINQLLTKAQPVNASYMGGGDGIGNGNKETTKESFTDYLNSLRAKYPSLDIDAEWEACQLWWSEGKKQMKRPKSALLNWLKRAEQMRQVNKPKGDLPRLEIDEW